MKKTVTGFFTAFLTMSLLVSFAFYGCKKETTLPKGMVKKSAAKKTVVTPETQKLDTALKVEDTPDQEGYIYKQRGRRDPFTSLITPIEKAGKDDSKIGTLEGYDLGEFALVAIAKKGTQYYALLVTSDNRSFTVDEGTTVGLSNGKVKEITNDKIVMVEYTTDYLGERIPRQILLEFHKGE